MNDKRFQQIWLEVTNVRIEGKEKWKEVTVQLKGDKADQEPVWWPVAVDPKGGEKGEKKAEEIYRSIAEGLDKKRTVLASLQLARPEDPPAPVPEAPAPEPKAPPAPGPEDPAPEPKAPPAVESLEVKYVRVQLTDSSAR